MRVHIYIYIVCVCVRVFIHLFMYLFVCLSVCLFGWFVGWLGFAYVCVFLYACTTWYGVCLFASVPDSLPILHTLDL